MATRSFTLTAEVPVDAASAVDLLADLGRHVGLHPFLVSADVVAEDPDGRWQEWRVVERPAVGWFRYRLRFSARLERSGPSTLSSTVRPLPGCRLDTVTTAAGTGPATLTETCTVTAPWPVAGYIAGQARRAHERTFGLLPGAYGER